MKQSTIKNIHNSHVKAYIPMYEPLQVSKCEKCGKVIAEPEELVGIREKISRV